MGRSHFGREQIIGTSKITDEMVARDEEGSAKFRLDAPTQAAKEAGILVERSKIRRILLREGVG